MPGEIIPSREFYDYESKYLDEGSQARHPGGPAEEDRRAGAGSSSIEAFKAIDGAGMSRVDFLLSRDDGTLYLNEVNTIPGFTTISMYREAVGRLGRRVPRPARSPASRSPSSATPKSSSSAPASHDAAGVLGAACWVLGARAACWRAGCAAASSRPHSRRGRPRRALDALVARLRRDPRRAIRRGARRELAKRVPRRRRAKPATCWPRPPPGGASSSIRTAARSTSSSRPRPSRPSARPRPGPRASRRTRRPTSTPAAPTRRGSSGACCATRSSPRRATASASSRRSSAPSRSTRTLDDAYFGIGLYQYYADVAPAAAKVLRFLLMLPGGDKTEGLARMQRARARGRAAPGRSRLPAADPLSLVREARRPRGRAPGVARTSAIRATRCSPPSSPTSRTATSTTSPPASRRGARCWPRRATAASTRPGVAETQARLGIARQLEALPPDRPRARTAARRARRAGRRGRRARWPPPTSRSAKAEDRLGHRDAAVAAYRLAVAAGPVARPAGDPAAAPAIASGARRMRVRAEAYRLSLEGLRRSRRGTSPAPSRCSRAASRSTRRDAGRALPLRPRAAGEEGGRGGARAVRGGDPRRARRARRPIVGGRVPRSRRASTSASARTRPGDRLLPHRRARWFGGARRHAHAQREHARSRRLRTAITCSLQFRRAHEPKLCFRDAIF